MRNRVMGVAALLLLGVVTRLGGQCGFPWTITPTDLGGGRVAVQLCGIWVGCFPHAPRFNISGNQIGVTLTAAELPDCICTQAQIDFDQTVIVSAVPAGTYSVAATIVECDQAQSVGTGNVVVSGSPPAAAVPALDIRGLVALALLVALVGVWKVRE